MERCPECQSEDIVLNGEGKICNRCGLVIDENCFAVGRAILR